MRLLLTLAFALTLNGAALAQSDPWLLVGAWVLEGEQGPVRAVNFQSDGTFCAVRLDGDAQIPVDAGAYMDDGATLHMTSETGSADARISVGADEMRWGDESWARAGDHFFCLSGLIGTNG